MQTWTDVDEAVNREIWKFNDPKPYDFYLRPQVQAVDKDGNLLIYPFYHFQWLEYVSRLWTLIQDVADNKTIPYWDLLAFRSENDFFANSFNAFSSQWLLTINKLTSDRLKFDTYNDIVNGCDLFQKR